MGAFSFLPNVEGRGMDPADFLREAYSQPLGLGANLLDQAAGAISHGVIGREVKLPEPAPTEPAEVFDAPGGGTVEIPQYAQERAGTLGPNDMVFGTRLETEQELESRRKAAGAITEEEYKASAAYRKDVAWDRGMTRARADALAADYDERKRREFFGVKRPISSFFGQLTGELANPFNYIPYTGPAVRAAAIAKFGVVGGTASVGALDASVGSLLTSAAFAPQRAQFGEETTWQGVVSDMAVSALVGTAFGAGLGYIGKRIDARRARMETDAQAALSTLPRTQEGRFVLDDAVTAVANGEPVNLSPASQAFAQDALDRMATLFRRAGQERDAGLPPALARHRVAAADGSSIDVIPTIVEARSLVTSADDGFDAALQPRQRDRAAAQAQIRQISSNLDPQRLGASAEADRGAPIVGPDGMVESGNGRVLALRDVYRAGGEPAARYRAFLEEQGVDISGFSEPVLVRVRETPLSGSQRQAFAVAANRPATLSMSATERARADAATLTPDTLALIRNPDDLAAAANGDFVRQFVRTLPQTEAGALTTPEGRVSTEGLTRVRSAVLAAAYEDVDTLSRVTEATDDNVKSISRALTAAAPVWAGLRRDIQDGRVPEALDVTPALLEAVRRTADMRAKGVKLPDYLRQIDAFDTMPETVEGFMRLMADPTGRRAASAERIASGIRRYAAEARKVSTDQGLGLGLDPVATRDLMALIRSEADGSGTGDLGLDLAAPDGDVADGTRGGGRAGRPGSGEPGAAARGGGDGGFAGQGEAGFRPATIEDVRGFREAAPERSLDQLYRDIPRHQEALEVAGADIGKALGVEFKTPGLKAQASAAEKMVRKGYQSTRQLTDLVRAGFVANAPDDVGAIATRLAQRFDVLDEGWTHSPTGYVDRKVLLRFDDGTVGEVQIWQNDMLAAKGEGGGHKLYTARRSLPRGSERALALLDEETALYSAAAAKMDGAWRDELSAGAGGSPAPNLALKFSSESTPPLSSTSIGSTLVQPLPGESMANASRPFQTAGRASQLMNFQAMDGSLFPDQPLRLDMGAGAPLVSDDVVKASEAAATRLGRPDDPRAMAEQFSVDPRTGEFPELAEVEQVRAEGRLSAEDEAELAAADKTFEIGSAYGDAIRAAVGCVL